MYAVSTTRIKIWSYFPHSLSWPSNSECYFGGIQDNMLKLVETRTIQSDLNIDVLPPLVVVFLQFKISMRFPRHMYKDMVLLSIVVLGPFKHELIR